MICKVFFISTVYNLQLSCPRRNVNCNSSVWLTFTHSFLSLNLKPIKKLRTFLIQYHQTTVLYSFTVILKFMHFAVPSSHGSQSKHAAHCTCSKPTIAKGYIHAHAKTTAMQQDSLKTRCHLENTFQSK